MVRCFVLVLGAATLLGVRTAPASTIAVPSDQSTIQAGIDVALAGDTVLVGPGTYNEALSFGGRDIVLLSSGGADATTVTGVGLSDPMISFTGGETRAAIVSGFTFTDGSRPGELGGAVLCAPGSPTIVGNTFADNYAASGGAIEITDGDPLIDSNLFAGNSCAVNGGAINVYGAAATITRNTFRDNSSAQYCGGVYSNSSFTVAKYNLFVGNHCPWKGGAYIATSASQDSVINNTFYGNRSDEGSGVLTIWYSTSTVALNNILAFNHGPAIMQGNSDYYEVDYNDLYGNDGGDYDGLSAGAHDISADPWYCDRQNGDYALDDDSPCLGAGYAGADIGAYGVGCTEPAAHIPHTIRVPEDQPTIQAGIDVALAGDTVLVGPGTYNEALSFGGRDILLLSSGGADVTTVTGAGLSAPMMSFTGGESRAAVVSGFTFTGGDRPGELGGAVFCALGSPTIVGNTFADNYATSGGAIVVTGGNPLIDANLFAGNSCAVNGGAVNVYEAAATITRNTFRDNFSAQYCGGVYSRLSSTIAKYNLFVGNHCPWKGGAYIASEGSQDSVINNTFYGNRSDEGTGVLTIWYATSTVALNNILAFNHGPAIMQGNSDYYEVDYNDLFENYGGDYDNLSPGAHDIAVDPMFCDQSTGIYTLHALSPCLGTGAGGSDIGALGAGCSGPFVANLVVGEGADRLHLVDHQPLIAWEYFDPVAQPLAMSEVEVGTDDDWMVAEMWQSPAIPGPDTSVIYSGAPLMDGETYHARARVNNGIEWSGWRTSRFRMNSPPGSPEPYAPPDGAVVDTVVPSLLVINADDAENDPLTYQFEVYSDEALTELVAAVAGLPGGSGATVWDVDPPLTNENGMYWWRSRAWDGFEDGPWCATRSFWLDMINTPPLPFELSAPSDGSVVHSLAAPFDWDDAFDPDPGTGIAWYILHLATDSDLASAVQYAGITQSDYVSDPVLSPGQRYWWKVQAVDKQGSMSESPVWSFQLATPGDLNNDGVFTVEDVVALVDIVFRDALTPDGILAIDVNGDCVVNVLDVVFLVRHVFRDGQAPGRYCSDLPLSGEVLRVPEDHPTIQEAVDAASHGDTVLVAPGTYTENVVVLSKYIVMLGDTVSHGVILEPDGIGSSPISFADVSRRTELVGFVVQHASDAPGVFCSDAAPTIRRNHIRDNTGGGIALTGPGLALIADNFIYRNESYAGAGILMNEASADVFRNVIDSNRAVLGGGILSDNRIAKAAKAYGDVEPVCVIAGNLFRGNFAELGGGGIYLYEGFPIIITGNLFVQDTSSFGGGMANSGRDVAMVIGNTFDACVAGIADGAGNAIWWARHADVGGVIKNNLVTNTISTTWWGGAIGGDDEVIGKVTIDYNALWNNQLGDFYGFSPGVNSLEADPLYCDPEAGDYHLDAASPCVGTGEGGVDRGALGVGCGIR
ncbi:MAG TPA: right-handed parallel beta-helix repeat-containing protein [Acidobacteriota bacterium]|nr:right-handed parallel beta-helix repeat-containing protein [Acidobacteriota bacterium]